ncbi:MAG: TatD family hydrolase [Hydrogenibacillus schlegelii]|nr:TatD family hydrolase [Hydrogenibacillus schlegelii]
MFDAHLHFEAIVAREDGTIDWDRAERLVERWRAGGVRGVLAVSVDRPSAERTLKLKERFPDFVFAALGEHPERPLSSERELWALEALIRAERGRIAAIGEVGLPHYARVDQKPAVRERLRFFAGLGRKLGLPLALHAVYDGAAEALSVLQEEGVRKAHFHWLKAPDAVVERILAAGYRVSVTPEVCYRKRARALARAVRRRGAPLLFETDGPWPYEGPFGGRPAEPLWLGRVRTCAAEAVGEAPEGLSEAAEAAFLSLFGSSEAAGGSETAGGSGPPADRGS